MVFSETAVAPRSDNTGSQMGWVHVEYWGSMDDSSGMAGLWLWVDTPDGTYRFDGRGFLTSVSGAKGEGVTYEFSGSYVLAEQQDSSVDPATMDTLPLHGGTFELRLRFWLDGTSLYSVGLKLFRGLNRSSVDSRRLATFRSASIRSSSRARSDGLVVGSSRFVLAWVSAALRGTGCPEGVMGHVTLVLPQMQCDA